jgi:hypothetical protein
MMINHNGVETELPDEWWTAAGMPNFVRMASAYLCDHAATGGRHVCLIPIADIEPVPRTPAFRNWEGISARERVESILRAIVADIALPPVQLTRQATGYPFSLKDGLHRLYCSIAAGFTDIPAVKFIDMKALDAGRDIQELC